MYETKKLIFLPAFGISLCLCLLNLSIERVYDFVQLVYQLVYSQAIQFLIVNQYYIFFGKEKYHVFS